MKIIWVTNVPIPEASILMNEKPSPYGGWLFSTADFLSQTPNNKLVVVFPKNGNKFKRSFEGKYITYYSINENELNNNQDLSLEKILVKESPDIVHIFGTEYSHSNIISGICRRNGIKYVVSIQGLISEYSKYYYADLPLKIISKYTFRDLLRLDNIFNQQKKFEDRGIIEIETLQMALNVIGRTSWDYSVVKSLNKNINYFHCNETLRESFYDAKWEYTKCKKYSIFVSQGNYPIKGLHFLLEALSYVLLENPDAHLYVSGFNPFLKQHYSDKIRESSYTQYILFLINKFKLSKHITFTGVLNENEILNMYLESNVFVLPSAIENSPNSLGEAMILGMPCVCSYVGGIPDLITHSKEGYLYQYNSPKMLAYYINQIFENKESINEMCRNARERALKIHDKNMNNSKLLEIYKEVLSK